MSQKTKYDYIKVKFEELKNRVKTDNKKGLFDINRILEDVSMKLLNDTYGWNLEKTNKYLEKNLPVDLIDMNNLLLIEVTSTTSTQKVRHLYEKVKNSKEYSQYLIMIFYINEKPNFTQRTLQEFEGKINFLGYEDILEIVKNNKELENKVYKTLRDFFTKNTWYIIYSKFSECLYKFYQLQGENSGHCLYEDYIEEDSEFEILPWVKHFKERNVTSLDPIHIFASFTYWNIRIETRKKKMLFFCNLLEKYNIDVDDLKNMIENSTNDNFQYFPHPNITYIVSARKHETQKEVWEFFSLIHQNIDNERLEDLFNNINANWYGVKIESATIFMFWINSENFISLDKNTLDFLKKRNKINKIPISYIKYKILIKKSNEFLFLYRNLVKIANNESFINELIELDRLDFEAFFDVESIEANVVEARTLASTQLDIDKVEEFEFEFYFIVSGKAKKIVYKKEKIESINELKIKSDKENIVYQNFQLIAIKALNEKYTKVLTSNKLYYFNKNFKILDDNILKINYENNINLYTGFNTDINITAIVGKNGTGKSTIIELLLMALNNITSSLSSEDKLIYPLEELFYTVHTNYSIYSLNTRDYNGDWLNKLFHKNDHYQIPIVIEPYRKEGNTDINILNEVSKQRLLSSILEPNINIDNTKLLEKKYATHLNISLNLEKITRIIKFLCEGEKKNIDEVLDYDKNKKIIEYINIKYINEEPKYKKEAELYICYKIKSIADIYYPKDNFYTFDFIKRLLDDKTHITFKLHQAINYLKYHTVEDIGEKLSIENLSANIKNIQEKNPLSIIELIPPAFFKVDIIINDNINFDTLSSGEKQKVYSISSIIYHLQNIESVHRSNHENIIKYNYVNLILDEIELYFHPDMQRTYIYDLLEAIENKGGFNHINALNIIMVTHSPFILSDIVESNIMYLGRTDDVEKTFGANIHTLLDNSFFMNDGLMGKFAKEKIKSLIEQLNEYKELTQNIREEKITKTERDEIKRIISQIGEPFLKKKLFDMYFSIFDEKDSELSILEREKKKLEEQIRKLQP